MNANVLSI